MSHRVQPLSDAELKIYVLIFRSPETFNWKPEPVFKKIFFFDEQIILISIKWDRLGSEFVQFVGI